MDKTIPPNLAKALMAAQAEFPEIPRNGERVFDGRIHRYATLDSILRTVQPILRNHGLMLTTVHRMNGNAVTFLTHPESGESINSETYLGHPKVWAAWGQSQTFARRYHTTGLLDLCLEDDQDAPNGKRSVDTEVTGDDTTEERIRAGFDALSIDPEVQRVMRESMTPDAILKELIRKQREKAAEEATAEAKGRMGK